MLCCDAIWCKLFVVVFTLKTVPISAGCRQKPDKENRRKAPYHEKTHKKPSTFVYPHDNFNNVHRRPPHVASTTLIGTEADVPSVPVEDVARKNVDNVT